MFFPLCARVNIMRLQTESAGSTRTGSTVAAIFGIIAVNPIVVVQDMDVMRHLYMGLATALGM